MIVIQDSNKRIALEDTIPDAAPLAAAAPSLIRWFSRYARKLPWRIIDKEKRPDPYRVWVSEIMLQQTRVEAVKGYYTRFIEAIPTVQSLAMIPENTLLKLWEGLGYYSRARNLQKAARIIMEQYQGQLPNDTESLLKLPGIGSYTAGAVASIAFRQPVPAVDGNVLRVVSRILDSRLDVSAPHTKELIHDVLQQIFASVSSAREHPDQFNQGLMELGAVVCIPNGAPQCLSCPINRYCLGYNRGTASELPVKEPKKPRRIEKRTILLLRWNEKTALHKRPSKGLLAGLWELPNMEGHLAPEAAAMTFGIPSEAIQSSKSLGEARHIFTHIQWEMIGWEITLQSDTSPGPDSWCWLTSSQISEEYSVPSALKAYSKSI